MKTNFIRKATSNELIPQDEFVIEKEVVIDKEDRKSTRLNSSH